MDAGAKRERTGTPPGRAERSGTQQSGNSGRLAKAVTANAQEALDSVLGDAEGQDARSQAGISSQKAQDGTRDPLGYPKPAQTPLSAILVAAGGGSERESFQGRGSERPVRPKAKGPPTAMGPTPAKLLATKGTAEATPAPAP